MNSLFPELIHMIYNQLYMPNDSLRFSLVNKYIHLALPEQIRQLFIWKLHIHKSLDAINSMSYSTHDILLQQGPGCMSIMKYNRKISIYQLFDILQDYPYQTEQPDPTLDVYIYLDKKYITRYRISKHKVTVDRFKAFDSPRCNAFTGLDISSQQIIHEHLYRHN